MIITLETRTADSVRTYFEKANRPEIKQVLPQKAKTVEEALADYEETLLTNATSSTAISRGTIPRLAWSKFANANR